MKQHLALINWVRFITMSNTSARARCAISGLAAIAELFIFLAWTNEWPATSNLAILCWLAALDVGFVFGTLGLTTAWNWRDRLVASGWLLIHLFSLVVLFFYALNVKMISLIGIFSIH